jgi:single-strand DNA-binding protein
MNNLNSIMIEGNMVRDPSLKSTPKGIPVCVFSIAFNRYFKQETEKETEVSYFDVETWADVAKNCYNQGRKGIGVRIMGRLKQNRWCDSEGKNRSKVCIVAERVEFKTGKPEYANNSRKNMPPTEQAQYQEEYVPTF